jgi:acyl dehydratase
MEMPCRYLEDFAVGQTLRSGRLLIDKERIKTFGAEFDPQPFGNLVVPRRPRQEGKS